ncbi:MAG: hypothetical protein KKB82_00300 [Candidatus Omnitrophica bacterium]|nr:hypothetical protein [Candidatus Omnitrophota bacterium]MBU1924342.1 hypothetical protein [Candidatus Omnitrophota bacterium]
MRNKLFGLVLISIIFTVVAGCGSLTDRINRLNVNMHKDEVRALFGKHFTAKASKVDNKGSVLDLWEYNDPKTKTTYQIYFLNDRVSQWGKREELKAFPELYTPTYEKN